MAVDTSFIGKKTGTTRVVVERGPVATFASAVLSTDAVYSDDGVAKSRGLPAIPAPATFGFVMGVFGTFPDMQPPQDPDTDPGAMAGAMKAFMEGGGLLLHGEQGFTYHRPIYVGDVLVGTTTIVDMYEKESKGKSMTFLVTETVYSDDKNGEPVLTTRMNLIRRG